MTGCTNCTGPTKATPLPVHLGSYGVEEFDGDLLAGLPDPLPTRAARRPRGWACLPAVREEHVAAFRALCRRVMAGDIPGPKASGDGIVICGGGKWWTMVVVAVRMIRATGCTLPILVYHRGELEPVHPEDLADVEGVSYHDTFAVHPAPRDRSGWSSKLTAVAHCGLRRVLFLDADAYPLSDPTFLLDVATRHRFAFWSEAVCEKHLNWHWYDMPASTSRRVPTVQGGQLAIDRLAAWPEVVLAYWLAMHADYTQHMDKARPADNHGLGDQDAWRVALAATGGRFHRLGETAYCWPAFLFCHRGKPLIMHRQGCKLWGDGRDKKQPHLFGEEAVWPLLQAQIRKAKARAA